MTDGDDRSSPVDWLRWAWTTDYKPVMYARELLISVGSVVAVGLVLFLISGVWPPMVAVESGSMDPHMERGDLVFVMQEGRLAPGFAESGVVTYRTGVRNNYSTFHAPGDVVVYRPDGDGGRTPIIHRARFWVNDSENWYDKADPRHMNAGSCAELANCPAPHAGFITKGDANQQYDQATSLGACDGTCDVVKPSWVVGTAEFRIPYLGYVKLVASGSASEPSPAGGATANPTPG